MHPQTLAIGEYVMKISAIFEKLCQLYERIVRDASKMPDSSVDFVELTMIAASLRLFIKEFLQKHDEDVDIRNIWIIARKTLEESPEQLDSKPLRPEIIEMIKQADARARLRAGVQSSKAGPSYGSWENDPNANPEIPEGPPISTAENKCKSCGGPLRTIPGRCCDRPDEEVVTCEWCGDTYWREISPNT